MPGCSIVIKLSNREGGMVIYTIFYEHDDVSKFIGFCLTRRKAKKILEKIKSKNGFCDFQGEFIINEFPMNNVYWESGFFTVFLNDE